MMNNNVELRAFDFEVRAERDEERGTFLTGTPIVYDAWTNLGWYDEKIAGIFTKIRSLDLQYSLLYRRHRCIASAAERPGGNRCPHQLGAGR